MFILFILLRVKYTFSKGEPNGFNNTNVWQKCVAAMWTSSNYVSLYSDNCGEDYKFICQRPSGVRSPRATCESGWRAFGNNCYKIFVKTSFLTKPSVECAKYSAQVFTQPTTYDIAKIVYRIIVATVPKAILNLFYICQKGSL